MTQKKCAKTQPTYSFAVISNGSKFNAKAGQSTLHINNGTPQNTMQAVMWYTKAANQGHTRAQNKLGKIHEDGLGAPQDYKQAYVWYSLVAGAGNSDASNARDNVAAKLTPQQLVEAQQQTQLLFNQIEANKKK